MKYDVKWKQRYDGDWEPVCHIEFLGCCDCGLVHKVEYKYLKKGKGKKPYILHSRYFRDKRRTAAKRRGKGVKIVAVVKKKS